MGKPQCVPVRPLWGGLTTRAVRRLEEHAMLMGMLQRAPVRHMRGGLKRRAVRRLEEHTTVRRVDGHAVARAGAPHAGRLDEARVRRLEEHAYAYAVLV